METEAVHTYNDTIYHTYHKQPTSLFLLSHPHIILDTDHKNTHALPQKYQSGREQLESG